jgi:Zn-dependent protease
MMVFAGFGWGRPVPVNPYLLGRRSPAALMWVSLAGPLSNFFMAVLAAVPLRLGLASFVSPAEFLPSSWMFLNIFLFANLFLGLFNLIPLAPLDGDKIAGYFFPPAINRVLDAVRPAGPILLIAILFVLPRVGFDFIGLFVLPPVNELRSLLIG